MGSRVFCSLVFAGVCYQGPPSAAASGPVGRFARVVSDLLPVSASPGSQCCSRRSLPTLSTPLVPDPIAAGRFSPSPPPELV